MQRVGNEDGVELGALSASQDPKTSSSRTTQKYTLTHTHARARTPRLIVLSIAHTTTTDVGTYITERLVASLVFADMGPLSSVGTVVNCQGRALNELLSAAGPVALVGSKGRG